MGWQRFASVGLVTLCTATLALASCGKKNNETNNTTSNNASNSMTNNSSNSMSNNGTTGSNNGTTGSNNNTIPPVPAEFGLEERPSNPTCVAFDRPQSPSALRTERAFSNVSFNDPLSLTQSPSAADDRWFVIEQAGRVMTMPNDDAAAAATVFIDIAARVTSGGEQGLLGFDFHPDWPNTAEAFLSYTAGGNSIISRFTSNDAGQTLDPASEEQILTIPQPYSNHNGGQITFGPDRFLYIGMGDGGSAGDPQEVAQDLNSLLGKFLRIDPIGGSPYAIPADNPFAGGGGREEIYAWGLRNPWRWSFDAATGDLWAGDVGQGDWEEVDLIELGGNYGWDDKEGSRCYEVQPCDDGPWIDPVVEYDHGQGRRSVTGGYVYRGTAIPALSGVYIFGDYASGHVYGVFRDMDGNPEMRELFQHTGPISAFGQGQGGEVFIVDYSGTMHRIIPDAPAGQNDFPDLLSETGCVDTADATKMASGMVPYTVNALFWSDNAVKDRWLALPDGETITVEANGNWVFPTGSVLAKNFRLEGELFETRLFVRHADGEWGGYSYEWNDAGTDATYVPGGRVKIVAGQSWIYPSSGDCMVCHTSIAGRTLGLENVQLDGDFTYPSTNLRANQVKTLGHIGMLDTEPDIDLIEALVDPYGDDDQTARARSYLHTNCAQCHRSGTPLRPKFDLTAAGNPLIDDELCNGTPVGSDLGNANARRLIPGDPDNSLIWLRMSRRDANGMPPIGSNVVDQAGVELIRAWIEGLDPCNL